MPIGVPRIIYSWGEELPAQWTDIYNFIFRRRMVFLMQYLDDELCNQICGLLINIHMEDRTKELEKKETDSVFKSSRSGGTRLGQARTKESTTASSSGEKEQRSSEKITSAGKVPFNKYSALSGSGSPRKIYNQESLQTNALLSANVEENINSEDLTSKTEGYLKKQRSMEDLLNADEDLGIEEIDTLEQYTLQKITTEWLNWNAQFFDYSEEPYLFYLAELFSKEFNKNQAQMAYLFKERPAIVLSKHWEKESTLSAPSLPLEEEEKGNKNLKKLSKQKGTKEVAQLLQMLQQNSINLNGKHMNFKFEANTIEPLSVYTPFRTHMKSSCEVSTKTLTSIEYISKPLDKSTNKKQEGSISPFSGLEKSSVPVVFYKEQPYKNKVNQNANIVQRKKPYKQSLTQILSEKNKQDPKQNTNNTVIYSLKDLTTVAAKDKLLNMFSHYQNKTNITAPSLRAESSVFDSSGDMLNFPIKQGDQTNGQGAKNYKQDNLIYKLISDLSCSSGGVMRAGALLKAPALMKLSFTEKYNTIFNKNMVSKDVLGGGLSPASGGRSDGKEGAPFVKTDLHEEPQTKNTNIEHIEKITQTSLKTLSQRKLRRDYNLESNFSSLTFNSQSFDHKSSNVQISKINNKTIIPDTTQIIDKQHLDRTKKTITHLTPALNFNAERDQSAVARNNQISFSYLNSNVSKQEQGNNEFRSHYRKQTERTFMEEESKKVFVIINSFGGSVGNGITVHDALQFIKAGSLTLGLGVAASAASLALAGGTIGERYVTEGCHVMIHQPEGGLQGQASDIWIDSQEIMKIRLDVAEIYSLSTYRPRHKILRDLDRDFYLTATETIHYGLADEIATNEVMHEIIEMTSKVWDYHDSKQQRLLESRENANSGLDTQTQN